MGELSELRAIGMMVQRPLVHLMQGALVRQAAFALFAARPRGFRTHPTNGSLTWHALEALEGSCVVQIVEYLRRPLVEALVPESVSSKLERLVGHRHVVGHPFAMKEAEWKSARMKRFEFEGRRHESRVPLVWDLQQAMNAELSKEGSELLNDFYVTRELAQQLRQIWTGCMRQSNLAGIPCDEDLVALLEGLRDSTLKQCQDRASGRPLPPRRETELDRMWAAKLQGEAVPWPADDD